MPEPFLAEIRMFSGNFAPNGWALCNGQLMAISQNTALFSLLGTTYGGDGRVTFALPNLMGVAPMQQGQGAGLSARRLGEIGGQQNVTVAGPQMPAHTHLANAVDAAGDATTPNDAIWASARLGRIGTNMYADNPPDKSMSPSAIGMTGGGQPHNNMPPYLCVSFIIALQGIFPQRP
ncbi:phage tail protein [Microlunatus sp. Gsoil 973]|jgi:microcystin-dependent protein|uniref:phage tail protein n=1 Tax=Microlunatus sp. Gsoil 973 TaxID=2672569 RepID=UPI0012B46775|nr:tail fiber protein [Microlunatus sp. Gsoil 973]QGN34368.1 phage tail protein [Microlunatus sp. Gsoil 973]